MVEQIHVRRCAGHEEINDALSLGRMMQSVQNTDAGFRGHFRFSAEQLLIEQRRQCDSAEACRTAREKRSAGGQFVKVAKKIHKLSICRSSIILSAVPRFVKRHIIPRLQLNPPIVVIFLWWASHQAESRPETMDLKRGHLDAIILNRTKLCDLLLDHGAGTLLV